MDPPPFPMPLARLMQFKSRFRNFPNSFNTNSITPSTSTSQAVPAKQATSSPLVTPNTTSVGPTPSPQSTNTPPANVPVSSPPASSGGGNGNATPGNTAGAGVNGNGSTNGTTSGNVLCPWKMQGSMLAASSSEAVSFKAMAMLWKSWCDKETLSEATCQATLGVLNGLGSNQYSMHGCLAVTNAEPITWLCHTGVYRQASSGPSTTMPQLCMQYPNFQEHCAAGMPNVDQLISPVTVSGPFLHGCILDTAQLQQCAWLVTPTLTTTAMTAASLVRYRTCASRPLNLATLSSGASSLYSSADTNAGQPPTTVDNKPESKIDVRTLSITIAASVLGLILLLSGVLIYRRKKNNQKEMPDSDSPIKAVQPNEPPRRFVNSSSVLATAGQQQLEQQQQQQPLPPPIPNAPPQYGAPRLPMMAISSRRMGSPEPPLPALLPSPTKKMDMPYSLLSVEEKGNSLYAPTPPLQPLPLPESPVVAATDNTRLSTSYVLPPLSRSSRLSTSLTLPESERRTVMTTSTLSSMDLIKNANIHF